MHFHDLRHWAASRLFAKGCRPHEVAEQLGHSKVSTTLDVYGQVLDRSAQRRAAPNCSASSYVWPHSTVNTSTGRDSGALHPMAAASGRVRSCLQDLVRSCTI